MTESTAPSLEGTPGPIVARAGRYYRNARYIMVVGILAMAGWFAYDGFHAWPAKNVEIASVNAELAKAQEAGDQEKIATLAKRQKELGKERSDNDILLNRLIALTLPLVAVGYLVFVLRRSRGEVRLDNGVLHAPGHPPVPLTAVTSVDDSRWKKKGIAAVHYTVDGKSGVITLDDFIYEQTPVDEIHDRLVAKQQATTAADASAAPSQI